MVENANINEIVDLTHTINKLKYDLNAIKKAKTINSIVIGKKPCIYDLSSTIYVGYAQRRMFQQYIDIDVIKHIVETRINDKLKIATEQRDKLIK